MPERASLRDYVTQNAGSVNGHPMAVSGRPVKKQSVQASRVSKWEP